MMLMNIVTEQGCQKRLDPFVKDPPIWSAKRISDYGFTRMHILNSTHLYLEQISDDQACHEDVYLILLS